MDEVAQRVREDLDSGHAEFHRLLAAVSSAAWNRRSRNAAWTNGQLLFHIALGFFLIVPLVIVMRVFAALPRGISKAFARSLNFATPFFNRINALGPRIGARILGARRLGAVFDSVHTLNVRIVRSIRPAQWQRGMHYPTRWEPRFSDFMTFEDLFRYPAIHLRHHAAQLELELER